MTFVRGKVTIYAESTPNPAAMKFVADKLLMNDNHVVEYKDKASAKSSPLAQALFDFPFVKNIFISFNYVTVIKSDVVEWDEIASSLRAFISEYLNSDKLVINEMATKEVFTDSTFTYKTQVVTQQEVPKNEIENKIIEILEEFVRPAVEQDGGLITFHSYDNGTVTVRMRGSCSGCPSATITLKSGIEALLMRSIPEIKEVIAEPV
jgi:Fe-S cluster biogenesis protein NfuA